MNFPNKKYKIIYADPPWNYENYSNSWHAGNPKSKWVGKQYPIMHLQDICNLPVPDIVDIDSILFLWATFPNLKDALTVMDAWGFTYKTVAFSWVKKNKVADSLFWGMGFWTRANVEICLLGTRGHPKRVSPAVHQVVISPIEKHSKKPNEVRERIVKLMGDLPRIELFAREKFEGWDVWGNEVEEGVNIE